MELRQVELNLRKLSEEIGFFYHLGTCASDTQISDAEKHLKVRFPEQVKHFFSHFDGLRISEPDLVVLALKDLNYRSPDRLLLAVFDNCHSIYFETSELNAAGEWNIVNEKGNLITMTMASFWSNKIWA